MMNNQKKMLVGMIQKAVVRGDIEQIRDQITPYTVALRDARGETLLHFAASDGYGEFLRLLIAAGADVDARAGSVLNRDGEPKGDLDGPTPLHEAAYAGHASIVQDLIQAGADVNVTHRGSLPLHDAALRGHSEVVKLLVAAGSRLDSHSFSWGGTPLELASAYDHQEVVAVLQQAEVAALGQHHGAAHQDALLFNWNMTDLLNPNDHDEQVAMDADLDQPRATPKH